MGEIPATESQSHWTDTLPVYENKNNAGFADEKAQHTGAAASR
jgi:hypothetical protein